MPHRRFINWSALHFEANKMPFYSTSSRSSGSSGYLLLSHLVSIQTLSVSFCSASSGIGHSNLHSVPPSICSYTPPSSCVIWEQSPEEVSLLFLPKQRKQNKTNTNRSLLTFSNLAMTGYARKNQNLLAYANHIKGHSHWQRFAGTEQVAVIVGEVTRDQNLRQIWANFMQFHSDYQTVALTLSGMHTSNQNKPKVQFNSNQVNLYSAFHIVHIISEHLYMRCKSLICFERWLCQSNVHMAEMYSFATLNSGMDCSMI